MYHWLITYKYLMFQFVFQRTRTDIWENGTEKLSKLFAVADIFTNTQLNTFQVLSPTWKFSQFLKDNFL